MNAQNDYFNRIEELPQPIREIAESINEKTSYLGLKEAKKRLNQLGWTVDISLDGLTNLRPVKSFTIERQIDVLTDDVVYFLSAENGDKQQTTCYFEEKANQVEELRKHEQLLIARGFTKVAEYETETL